MSVPIELLWIIIDSSKHEKVERLLVENEVNNKLVLMGKGTAKSTLGDIFSFGILDRDVIVCVVNTAQSQSLCQKLDKLINPHGPTGVIFTTPIDAISSDLFGRITGEKVWKKS